MLPQGFRSHSAQRKKKPQTVLHNEAFACELCVKLSKTVLAWTHLRLKKPQKTELVGLFLKYSGVTGRSPVRRFTDTLKLKGIMEISGIRCRSLFWWQMFTSRLSCFRKKRAYFWILFCVGSRLCDIYMDILRGTESSQGETGGGGWWRD